MKKIKKVMATVLLLCMISSMLIVPAAASEITASEISLNFAGKTLAVGGSFELKAAFEPESAAPTVTWISDAPNIAAVNENGIITGVAEGTAVITASVYDGQLTAECTVTVVTETEESPIVYATGVSLGEQTSLSLEPYGYATLVATVAPENASNKFVAWVSSDENVVTVDENGNVAAVGLGTAIVSAIAADVDLTAEDLSTAAIANCTVTVSEPYVEPDPTYVEPDPTYVEPTPYVEPAPAYIAVSGISIDRAELTLTEGESAMLSAYVNADATNQNIIWSVDIHTVASVENGYVTALSAGNATIYAVSEENNQIYAVCYLTVNPAAPATVPVSGITISSKELVMTMGDVPVNLTAYVNADATNQNVYWTIDIDSVASVEGGVITPLSEGSATIYAISEENGNIYETCALTVNPATPATVPVSGITISNKELVMTMGDVPVNLTAYVNADATNQNVYWTVDIDTVASVEGGVITPLSEGSATIYAISEENGNIYETCALTVNPAAPATVPVSSISIDPTELTLTEGESANLYAAVNADATNQNIYWTVDIDTVASVDNGYVTALSAGNAVIYAVSEENGNIYATCNLTVNPATPASVLATSVTLDHNELTLKVGDGPYTLTATVNPEATDQTVYWVSDDSTVAAVENGLVTPGVPGRTTVYAVANDGSNMYAACTVIVEAEPVIMFANQPDNGSVTSYSIVVGLNDDGNDWTYLDLSTAELNNEPYNYKLKASLSPAPPAGDPIYKNSYTWTLDERSTGIELSASTTGENSDVRYLKVVSAGSGTIEVSVGGISKKIEYVVQPLTVDIVDNQNNPMGDTLGLDKGGSVQLYSKVNFGANSVTWDGSAYGINVDANGLVTVDANATSGASTIVTAISTIDPNAKDSITISVNYPVTTPVDGVSLDEKVVNLKVGESITLTATVQPDNATNKNVLWSTDKPDVATVSNGTVTAVAPGTTKITVTTEDGGLTDICEVTVSALPTVKIVNGETNDTEKFFDIGDGVYYGLSAKLENAEPENGKDFLWTVTGDTGVIELSYNGNNDKNCVIDIKGIGTVEIVASYDGIASAPFTITVQKMVKGITLPSEISIKPGESYNLGERATLDPAEPANKTLTWSSSDGTGYISVDSNGIVTAESDAPVGQTANISATAADPHGRTSNFCRVTVVAATVPVENVIITKSVASLTVGQTFTFEAKVNPDTATDRTIQWASTNPAVAYVDPNTGLVTAKGNGTTQIQASAGNKSAAVNLTVSLAPNSTGVLNITASPQTISTTNGYSVLTATVNGYVINGGVNWSVSDPNMASVSSNGVVTAKRAGSFVVTGIYDNNNTRYTGTVLITASPVITSGNYSNYDGKNIMYFKTNQTYPSWRSTDIVSVDGMQLRHGQHCYVGSSTDGYVLVALNPQYLNTLPSSVVHTIRIGPASAPAVGYFRTYTGQGTVINGVMTGDENQAALWAALCVMGILGCATILIARRKDWNS